MVGTVGADDGLPRVPIGLEFIAGVGLVAGGCFTGGVGLAGDCFAGAVGLPALVAGGCFTGGVGFTALQGCRLASFGSGRLQVL